MRLEPSDLEDTIPVALLAHRKKIIAHVSDLRQKGAPRWGVSWDGVTRVGLWLADWIVVGLARGVGSVFEAVGAFLWWISLVLGIVGAIVFLQPELRKGAMESLAVAGVMGWYQLRQRGVKELTLQSEWPFFACQGFEPGDVTPDGKERPSTVAGTVTAVAQADGRDLTALREWSGERVLSPSSTPERHSNPHSRVGAGSSSGKDRGVVPRGGGMRAWCCLQPGSREPEEEAGWAATPHRYPGSPAARRRYTGL